MMAFERRVVAHVMQKNGVMFYCSRSTAPAAITSCPIPPPRRCQRLLAPHCSHSREAGRSSSSLFGCHTVVIPPRTFSSIAPTTSSTATKTEERETAVAIPIDFDVASQIQGNESQILIVRLEPNQVLRAESGAMMYMTPGVQMNTTLGQGGISSGFRRMLTGQNVFLSDFTYDGERGTTGTVCLGTDFPSKIVKLSVDQYGGKIVCQKGALLCANPTIDIHVEFTKKLSTGFFGGEGFVLQALVGEGDVFVKAGGTLIRRELDEGEVIRISSGCLVAFSNGVDYDIQQMPGFKNVLFGGEGLFVTILTGPGTVWLQGQPPQRMISEIVRRVPSGGAMLGVPLGMGAGGSASGDEGGEDTSESNSNT